ncbi:hypothetical protein EYF80_010500 [Liparis tanakae]|uniref:Uncharacterized protein n=1 Tax=Liparis tanakae TaxID=230148 RepID=A0A4Z2IN16_9TELE|nr:hypothetical protein EYF80_010500 [Liparis tanakae]
MNRKELPEALHGALVVPGPDFEKPLFSNSETSEVHLKTNRIEFELTISPTRVPNPCPAVRPWRGGLESSDSCVKTAVAEGQKRGTPIISVVSKEAKHDLCLLPPKRRSATMKRERESRYKTWGIIPALDVIARVLLTRRRRQFVVVRRARRGKKCVHAKNNKEAGFYSAKADVVIYCGNPSLVLIHHWPVARRSWQQLFAFEFNRGAVSQRRQEWRGGGQNRTEQKRREGEDSFFAVSRSNGSQRFCLPLSNTGGGVE